MVGQRVQARTRPALFTFCWWLKRVIAADVHRGRHGIKEEAFLQSCLDVMLDLLECCRAFSWGRIVSACQSLQMIQRRECMNGRGRNRREGKVKERSTEKHDAANSETQGSKTGGSSLLRQKGTTAGMKERTTSSEVRKELQRRDARCHEERVTFTHNKRDFTGQENQDQQLLQPEFGLREWLQPRHSEKDGAVDGVNGRKLFGRFSPTSTADPGCWRHATWQTRSLGPGLRMNGPRTARLRQISH